MDENIEAQFDRDTIRVLGLIAVYGCDLDRLLEGQPELTAEDVARAVLEVLRRTGVGPTPAGRSGRGKRVANGEAYQLKVTLRGSKPPIWRRVVVPGELTLEQLHEVLQVAMGWENCHLHEFNIEGEDYAGPGMDGEGLDNGELDERRYRLCDVVDREKAKFVYEYDFGDGWDHTVVVEKIIAAADRPRMMVCLAGKGRCPPEDCGGIWGYYQLLEVLGNPKDKEHRAMKEWAGGIIDPSEFDAEAVTAGLGALGI